jgi:hypothetical protein
MKKSLYILSFLLVSFNFVNSQNNALNFSGFTNDIALNYNSTLDFTQNSVFSVEGWFNTTANTAVFVSNKVDQSPFTGWEVAVVYTKFVFEITNDYISSALRVETINAFNDGNWHHFAVIYKGIPNANNVDLYVDGTLQAKVISTNNLSSSPVSGNAVHIGSRNGTTYFTQGTLDELRIWNKALCASEITARKNCELTGNETNLLAYYKFNQGIGGGNNSTVTTLIDNSGNNNSGTLNGFSLSGSSSNWITSTTGVSGTCSYNGPIAISGTSIICTGNSSTLTASGATSYTWSTSSNSPSISVSPTITTTYSVSGTNANNGCKAVTSCAGLAENSLEKGAVLFPNPFTSAFKIAGTGDITEIRIYTDLGTLIYSGKPAPGNEIDLLLQPSGIYIVQFNSSGTQVRRKIVKE